MNRANKDRNEDGLKDIDIGLREAFRLRKKLMSDFSHAVGDPRLTSSHYRALLHLRDQGPECMKGICRHIGLEAGSFTPVADRLIEEGFAERFGDPGDRRRVLLRLTGPGREKAEEVRSLVRRHIGEKLSVLDGKLF
ncbi:MAG: MarR family transcriptional regulator, partial [Spirochaetaceae bacterium]|nr:MarR family transcriptional regulator [Spirochaetaceae bacterium]